MQVFKCDECNGIYDNNWHMQFYFNAMEGGKLYGKAALKSASGMLISLMPKYLDSYGSYMELCPKCYKEFLLKAAESIG